MRFNPEQAGNPKATQIGRAVEVEAATNQSHEPLSTWALLAIPRRSLAMHPNILDDPIYANANGVCDRCEYALALA